MNTDSDNNPHSPATFDPHGEQITSRDWTFFAYMLGLCVVPFILILIVFFNWVVKDPNFDNFPKGKPKYPPGVNVPVNPSER